MRVVVVTCAAVLWSTAASATVRNVACVAQDGGCDPAPLQQAVAAAQPGDDIVVAAGRFRLTAPLRLTARSTKEAPLRFRGAPGERPTILDAGAIHLGAVPKGAQPPFARDNGTVQLEGCQHVLMSDVMVVNSRQQGVTVRDCSHVEIARVSTDYTFSSGIGVWDTQNDGAGTEDVHIHHCRVRHANHLRLQHEGYTDAEAPHEAISIGGARGFVVEDNVVEDGFKEGIDVKETSRDGVVRNNVVRNMDRQGIYVGAWGGVLEGIVVSGNTVVGNRGAGIVLGVEDGKAVNRNVTISGNTIEDNQGTGIWFARFADGKQEHITISKNRVTRNGFGAADRGAGFFWITGGIWLHGTQTRDVNIVGNVVVDNAGFGVGWSRTAARDADRCAAGVVVDDNHVAGAAAGKDVRFGWPRDDLVFVDDLDAAFFARCNGR